MLKRPAFWILLALASHPRHRRCYPLLSPGFSIVALDITMTRERALERCARRSGRATASARRATVRRPRSRSTTRRRRSSSSKAAARTRSRACCATASTPPTRGASATSGKARPTRRRIRFTPDGRPYGFVERLKEDAPGAALDASAARAIAEEQARGALERRLRPVRARRAGAGTAARRTRRSHAHLRARRRRRSAKDATGCAWSSPAIG